MNFVFSIQFSCSNALTANVEDANYEVTPGIYVARDADNELESDDIETEWTMDPPMNFPFLASTFAIDGSFLGFQSVDGGFLQLCEASDNILNAAFVFGTYYSHTVSGYYFDGILFFTISNLMDM